MSLSRSSTQSLYDPPTSPRPSTSRYDSSSEEDSEREAEKPALRRLQSRSGSKIVASAVDPMDDLRREGVWLQFLGTGSMSLGSALVIVLSVTGPPRFNEGNTASTTILFFVLIAGVLASTPCWVACIIMLKDGKPPPNQIPPHARTLRFCAFAAMTLSMIYAVAGLVLWILVQEQQSFVSFCLQNVPSLTDTDCQDRWNREWVILLAVGLSFILHVSLGFPVYRYARGDSGGPELQTNLLFAPGQEEDVPKRKESLWTRWRRRI